MTRSFQIYSLLICMEATTTFTLNTQVGRGSTPLLMDIAIVNSELFRRHKRREGKNLLFHLTLFNSCAPTNLEREANRSGATTTAAVKRKQNKYWVVLPATYTLFTLAA